MKLSRLLLAIAAMNLAATAAGIALADEGQQQPLFSPSNANGSSAFSSMLVNGAMNSLFSPDNIHEGVETMRDMAKRDNWESDFNKYAAKFEVVRNMCDAATKPLPTPKTKQMVLPLATELRYRQAKKYQQMNLKNQLEMLHRALDKEMFAANCPLVLGVNLNTKILAQAGETMLSKYLQKLIADIEKKQYGQCRDDIDKALGVPIAPPRKVASQSLKAGK